MTNGPPALLPVRMNFFSRRTGGSAAASCPGPVGDPAPAARARRQRPAGRLVGRVDAHPDRWPPSRGVQGVTVIHTDPLAATSPKETQNDVPGLVSCAQLAGTPALGRRRVDHPESRQRSHKQVPGRNSLARRRHVRPAHATPTGPDTRRGHERVDRRDRAGTYCPHRPRRPDHLPQRDRLNPPVAQADHRARPEAARNE